MNSGKAKCSQILLHPPENVFAFRVTEIEADAI